MRRSRLLAALGTNGLLTSLNGLKGNGLFSDKKSAELPRAAKSPEGKIQENALLLLPVAAAADVSKFKLCRIVGKGRPPCTW